MSRRPIALAALATLAACGASSTPAGAPSATLPGVQPSATSTAAPRAGWPALDFDYLDRLAATLNFSLGHPTGLWVAPDGKRVLFRRSAARSFVSDLWSLDVASGEVAPLLRAEELLAGADDALTAEEKARRERMRLATRGVTGFTASRDGRVLLVPLGGRLFVHDRASGQTRPIAPAATPYDPRISPAGDRAAYVADGELHVIDLASGADRRVTPRAKPGQEWGVAEFVAQEEMARLRGFWWSPDGKTLAVQRSDLSEVQELHVADPMHPERAPTVFRYPRVGTPNASVELALVPAAGGAPRWIRWDRARFPYLAAVTWPERGPLTIVVQNRAQTEEQVLAVAASGATRVLLEEKDAAWLNLDRDLPRWLPDGERFLWSTERAGDWQLELRGADGGLVRTLTEPGFGYRRLAGVDGERGIAWVVASPDARRADVWEVPLEGGAPRKRSTGDGLHDLVTAEGGGAYVITSELRDGARRVQVFHKDGGAAGELPSVAEAPPYLPTVELADLEIEGRTHHAAIIRPRAFDRGRRYPVLLDVYGGPHVTYVKATPWAYLMDQWLADAGFVVVRIDGRGTPGRGRAWERAIAGDLATIPLADQVAGLAALFERYPELDRSRVGVTGWSFGGTMAALGVLLRPDVFRAAVSGAPVTDWLDYDTHYTERYMGLVPDRAEAYRAASPVSHADRLERPLLIVHGTTDDNVHLRHALELADALFRAEKRFELLPLNGFTHMVPDPKVKRALYGRIVDFFRRTLDGSASD